MPIPLAHPAAVLPLRRFCPRRLSFCALVIGSLLPDFAYALDDLNKFSRTLVVFFGSSVANFEYVRNEWDWDDFSHTFAGSIVFCLPVGLFVLYGFLALRSDLVATLPSPHWRALHPLCESPKQSLLVNVSSLLIGIWLHVGWDSFTNGARWLGHHWAFLHIPVVEFGRGSIELHRLLWLLSSLGGTIVLLAACLQFLKARKLPLWVFTAGEAPYYLLWSAMGILSGLIAIPFTLRFAPFGPSAKAYLVFLHRFAGYYMLALGCSVIVVALLSKLNRLRLNRP